MRPLHADCAPRRIIPVRLAAKPDATVWRPQATPLCAKDYPMPFAKKSDYPDLASVASRFEQELIALKANGAYQKIRDKWLK